MAASFYSSPLIGATTTLACFAHEIPHEIADYSILVRSGFTKRQAMQSQFLTAVGAFVSLYALVGRGPSLTKNSLHRALFTLENLFAILLTAHSDVVLRDDCSWLDVVRQRSGESLPTRLYSRVP